MLIHTSPNVDTQEHTSTSYNTTIISEDKSKSAVDVIIMSITTAGITIIHETANTKPALQARLVQILMVALQLVLCLAQISI